MVKGALTGCGFFAQNHLHAWRDIVGAEIVALCDRDEVRLAATAATFGITHRIAASRMAGGGFRRPSCRVLSATIDHRAMGVARRAAPGRRRGAGRVRLTVARRRQEEKSLIHGR